MKTLQAVDGRQAAQRIGQFDQLAVDQVPIAHGALHAAVPIHRDGETGLAGGVGQRVSGAVGEDVLLGHFQGGVADGKCMEAPDGCGGMDIERIAAKKLG